MLLLTYFSVKSLKDGWFHFFPWILQDQGCMYNKRKKMSGGTIQGIGNKEIPIPYFLG